MEFTPHSHPENSKFLYLYINVIPLYIFLIVQVQISISFAAMRIGIPEQQRKQHSTTRWDGPKAGRYGKYGARFLSYTSWLSDMKQNPDKLIEAGIFYIGKSWRRYHTVTKYTFLELLMCHV